MDEPLVNTEEPRDPLAEPSLPVKIYKWYRDSKNKTSDWREEARTCYNFYASEQWNEEDIAELEKNERPYVTFNRVAPLINAISGFETSNRTEIKYLPRAMDDGGVEIYNHASKWARQETDAEYEQSDAFKDVLICGMGWTCTEMDYEDLIDGVPKEIRVSPLNMYWDPAASKHNLMDAKYVIHAKELSREEFESTWPGMSYAALRDEDINENIHDQDEARFYRNNQGTDSRAAKLIVLHACWFEREPFYRFVDPQTGKIAEASAAKFEKLKPLLEQAGIEAVKQNKKVYYQATVAGATVLEDKKPAAVEGRFYYQAITGYRDEVKNLWWGLMRLMKDPQRWSNKFMSQFLDIVGANAKGGLIVEEGYLAHPRSIEDDWANPHAVIKFKEGGIDKYRERTAQAFPASTDRLLQLAVAATRDVVGINLEFLGMANREQAGMLEVERKRSALVILSDLFSNLRRFKKSQGKVLLWLIHKYMQPGQLIRIGGEGTEQYVPFVQDPQAIHYDVVCDTSPTSPNAKQEAWMALRELLPTAISAGIPVPPSVIKYLPIPESVAMEWMQYIQQTSDAQNDPGKALELGEKKAKIEETQSKTVLNYAKAQNDTGTKRSDS